MKFYLQVYRVFALAFILQCVPFLTSAQERDSVPEINDQVILSLVDQKDDAIQLTEDDLLIRLNPEKLTPCPRGLLLKTQHQGTFLLPMVISDDTGSYIIRDAKLVYSIIRCSNCKTEFPVRGNGCICPECDTDNCYYPDKEEH